MDTVIFIVSKLLSAFLRPDTWIICGVALVVFALVRGWPRAASRIGFGLLCAMMTLAILPIGNLLLQPIERTFPTDPPLEKVEGVVILGGGENAQASAYWGQVQLNEGGDRLAAGLGLARRFPEAKILFAGGSGTLRDLVGGMISEASVAEHFFLDQGIASDRILLEGQSRNTTENARLTLDLARPGPTDTWVLVTSAFHMPRAMHSFESAGWPNLVAWPVDYRTTRFSDDIGWDLIGHLQTLSTATREWVAILAYKLMQR